MRKASALFSLLVRDILAEPLRSALTVLNLGVISTSFFMLAALSHALYLFGSQPVDAQTLVILSNDTIDPMQSRIPPALLQDALSLGPASVQRVSPLLFYHLRVEEAVVQVWGAPLADLIPIHHLALVSGSWPVAGEVLISEGALGYTKWKTGSVMEIYGTRFRISGVVRAPGSKFSSVWISYPEADALFQAGGDFQMGFVQIAPGSNPDSVRHALETLPALAGRFSVYYLNTIFQRLTEVMQSVLGFSLILAAAALLSATFGVYTITHLNLAERRRELALLQVVGFSIPSIRRFVAVRVLALGGVSFLLGWVAALAVIRQFEAVTPIIIGGYRLPLVVDAATFSGGLLLELVFSLVGVWLPTRSLSQPGLAGFLRE